MHEQAKNNFQKWFKASKVVNGDGSPRVVYHGTTADFSNFDPSRTGEVADIGFYGPGCYFTNDPEVAARYAKRATWGPGQPDSSDGAQLMPVYLALKNPFYTKEETFTDQVIEWLKESNHDGVISEASEDGSIEYVVFRPEQVKSAIGNSGIFNPADPDMTDRRAAAENALNFLAGLQRKVVPRA